MNNLNLKPFTLGADGPRAARVRLSFNKSVTLAFNDAASSIVVSQLGERFAVQFDPQSGCVALTKGADRRLSAKYGTNWRDVQLSAIRDDLQRVYGKVRRVYFDVETYDNAVELVPNGKTA